VKPVKMLLSSLGLRSPCSGETAQAHPNTARSSLDALQATASDVLTRHVDRAGTCVACSQIWPCGLVVLAENNVAGI
jgi:hypothetical protein